MHCSISSNIITLYSRPSAQMLAILL